MLAIADHLPERAPQELAEQRVRYARQQARQGRQRRRVEHHLGVGVVAVVREDQVRRGPAGGGVNPGLGTVDAGGHDVDLGRRRPPAARTSAISSACGRSVGWSSGASWDQLEPFDPAVARGPARLDVFSDAVSSQRRAQSRKVAPAPLLQRGQEVGQARRSPQA